jgi:hypothetical protein
LRKGFPGDTLPFSSFSPSSPPEIQQHVQNIPQHEDNQAVFFCCSVGQHLRILVNVFYGFSLHIFTVRCSSDVFIMFHDDIFGFEVMT